MSFSKLVVGIYYVYMTYLWMYVFNLISMHFYLSGRGLVYSTRNNGVV